MKKELFLKVKEDVFNYIRSNATNNKFYGTQLNIQNAINSNYVSVKKALTELENENKVKLIQKCLPHKYKSTWEVIDSTVDNTGKENLNLTKNKEINQEDKNLENKNNDQIIDLNKYTIEQFNNINLRIYNTSKGLAIQVSDIIAVLRINGESIYQLLENNKELFDPFMVKEKVGNNLIDNEKLFLTKDGLIGLLMKIPYIKLSDEKKKLVLGFQRWAIEKLSTLISKGKVELTDIEQAKIQDNIKDTLELNTEDIDQLFNDLKLEVSNKINTMKSTVKEYKDRVQEVEMDNLTLKEINNKYRTTAMQLRDEIRNLK